MIPFLNITLEDFVNFFHPLIANWLWPLAFIAGFTKTIPIIGMFVPSLFFLLSAGIYISNPSELLAVTIFFTFSMLVSDLITEKYFYKFWNKAIEKTIYKDKIHKLFKAIKKAPKLTIFGGTWSNYIRPHIVIAAKHADEISPIFWILRFLSLLIINLLYSFGGFLLSSNIQKLSDWLNSFSNVITLLIIVFVLIGFYFSYRKHAKKLIGGSNGVKSINNLPSFFKSIIGMEKND